MKELLFQLQHSLDQDHYYLCLFVALTIPDICGAISSDNGEANGQKYRDWYTQYVYPTFNTLTAEECYHYRCTALHQGKSIPNKNKDYHRIIFLEPNQRSRISVNRIKTPSETAIMIDLRSFVEAMIQATNGWLKVNESADNYKKNYTSFMQRYPNGFGQFVKGFPVIT